MSDSVVEPPTTAMKIARLDTTLILALSAWLIFNSHLETYYPTPWLAADGLLGNSMFFVVSGFGIASSLSGRQQTFRDYGLRRFWRLYPAVLITLGLQTLFVHDLPIRDFMGILRHFIWPTPFTYVVIVVPLYIIYFIFFKTIKSFSIYLLLSLALIIYFYTFYINLPFHLPFQKLSIGKLPLLISYSYFTCTFAAGAIFADRRIGSSNRPISLLFLGVTLATYFSLKFAMVVQGFGSAVYPLLHGLVILACLLSLKTLSDPGIVKACLHLPLIGWLLQRSGTLSLEIYVIHAVLLGLAIFHIPPFPLNILSLALTTFILSIVLARVTTWLRNRWGI